MDSVQHYSNVPANRRGPFPNYPPQRAREVARDELLRETMRRNQAVRWTFSDGNNEGDRLVQYQQGKPTAGNADPIMGSMRQHLFAGMRILQPRDAVRLMNALESAEVVSRAPRQVVNMEKLDAVLADFRTGFTVGALFGKPLSKHKQERVRALLQAFDHLARQRAAFCAERARQRTALSANLDAQMNLLDPYGHDAAWYRARLLADGSVQQAQDAYVRCTELLHTYPSSLPGAMTAPAKP